MDHSTLRPIQRMLILQGGFVLLLGGIGMNEFDEFDFVELVESNQTPRISPITSSFAAETGSISTVMDG